MNQWDDGGDIDDPQELSGRAETSVKYFMGDVLSYIMDTILMEYHLIIMTLSINLMLEIFRNTNVTFLFFFNIILIFIFLGRSCDSKNISHKLNVGLINVEKILCINPYFPSIRFVLDNPSTLLSYLIVF